MRKSFGLVLLCGLIFISCTNLFTAFTDKGSVTISLPEGSNAKLITDNYIVTDVTTYEINLETSDGKVIENKTVAPGNAVQFTDVTPGDYYIKVLAFNDDKECIAYGQTGLLTVKAGSDTLAAITMLFNTLKNLESVSLSKTVFTLGEVYYGSNPSVQVIAKFNNGYTRALTSDEYFVDGFTSEDENKTIEDSDTNLVIGGEEEYLKITIGGDETASLFTKQFPITVNVDTPVITNQKCEITEGDITEGDITEGDTGDVYNISMDVSAYSVEGIKSVIYQSTSANMDGKEVSTSSTLVSGAFESSSINISCSSLPTSDDDGNTLYYQIEVTNTNEAVNGNKTATALSTVFGGKVVAISAEYIGDYVITEETSIVPPDLSPNLFKITKTYSDGSTALETSADLTNYKLDSSATSGENTYIVGNLPFTLMYKDVSCTVKVPYKYNPTFEMGIDVTSNYSLSSGGSTGAVSIPQYVGTATLTAKDAGNSGVYASYKLYDNGKLTDITTSYSYQWYSSTTKDGTGSFISGAAKTTYEITNSSTAGTTYYYYIVTASSSAPDFMISEENFATSDRQQITIQAYSLSLVSTAGESYTHGSGSSRTLTQEATYTVTLINDADTKLSEEGVAWSLEEVSGNSFIVAGPTEGATNEITLTAPTGTASAKLVAKIGDSTVFSMTVSTTELTLSSITATFTPVYLDACNPTLPTLENFKVVRTYSDSSTSTDSYATEDKYTLDLSLTEWTTNFVGNMTATITDNTDTSKSSEVTVPYKYTINVTPTISSDEVTTGPTLTCSCSLPTITYYANQTQSLNQTIKYQWYKDGNEILSNGDSDSYIATESGNYYCSVTISSTDSDYCTNASGYIAQSDTLEVTVNSITTFAELEAAIATGVNILKIEGDITVTAPLSLTADTEIVASSLGATLTKGFTGDSPLISATSCNLTLNGENNSLILDGNWT